MKWHNDGTPASHKLTDLGNTCVAGGLKESLRHWQKTVGDPLMQGGSHAAAA